MKKKWISMMLAMAVMTAATGCGLLPAEEELPTAPVLTEAETEEYVVSPVVRGDVRVTATIRATFTPSSSEKLSFKLGDERISKVYVELGDTVKAGDVLMELDMTDIDEQILQQQNKVDDLYLSLDHLYQNQEIAAGQAYLSDLEAAENSVPGWTSQSNQVLEQYSSQAQQIQNDITVAELRLEELQEQRKERQIIASIDGTITYLYEFTEYERSVEDMKVVTLSNMEEAMFEVYSDNGDLLVSGQTYTLLSGDAEYEVVAHGPGELTLPNLNAESTYLSMVTPDPSLEQGASGTVEVVLEESLDTLYVASSAVNNLRGEAIVYCVDEQGYREMRNVKIGISTDKVTEILEGLSEGEVVIVE